MVSLSAQARIDGIPAGGADWRHIGNSALDLGLASVATGPVARVWYSTSGDRLYANTASGHSYLTSDFEQWNPAGEVTVPPVSSSYALTLPESGAQVREAAVQPGRLYAYRRQVWRSDDGGAHWTALTSFRGTSLLGADVTDLTISPRDADEIAAAAGTGVWHSVDAGASWSGLNEFLPNLPAYRIVGTPAGTRGLRIGLTAAVRDLEWPPGEKTAWQPLSQPSVLATDAESRRTLSQLLRASITAAGSSGEYQYAGSADGRLWGSSDSGSTWRTFGSAGDSGPVTAIFVDPKDPRIALASSGAKPAGQSRGVHIRKTMNGGVFWDDLTANLPDVAAS